jgi:hypothetical protein
MPFIRKNVEKCGRTGQGTDDNIRRRMRIECWMTKATHTHSEYAILIAFSLYQWLRERSSMLYVHCLVLFSHRFVSTVNEHHS